MLRGPFRRLHGGRLPRCCSNSSRPTSNLRAAEPRSPHHNCRSRVLDTCGRAAVQEPPPAAELLGEQREVPPQHAGRTPGHSEAKKMADKEGLLRLKNHPLGTAVSKGSPNLNEKLLLSCVPGAHWAPPRAATTRAPRAAAPPTAQLLSGSACRRRWAPRVPPPPEQPPAGARRAGGATGRPRGSRG